jgi:hypothetical protein
MTYLEIPTRSDVYSYTETVTLDAVSYVLSFRYNSRMARWIFSISTTDGIALLAGIPLLPSYPLTDRFIGRIEGLPAGQFVLIDETGAERVPGIDDLGKDIKLIYVSED